METIDLDQLLKEHTREEVQQILVDAGIASDLAKADFIIAVSIGESNGDIIEVGPDEAQFED